MYIIVHFSIVVADIFASLMILFSFFPKKFYSLFLPKKSVASVNGLRINDPMDIFPRSSNYTFFCEDVKSTRGSESSDTLPVFPSQSDGIENWENVCTILEYPSRSLNGSLIGGENVNVPDNPGKRPTFCLGYLRPKCTWRFWIWKFLRPRGFFG